MQRRVTVGDDDDVLDPVTLCIAMPGAEGLVNPHGDIPAGLPHWHSRPEVTLELFLLLVVSVFLGELLGQLLVRDTVEEAEPLLAQGDVLPPVEDALVLEDRVREVRVVDERTTTSQARPQVICGLPRPEVGTYPEARPDGGVDTQNGVVLVVEVLLEVGSQEVPRILGLLLPLLGEGDCVVSVGAVDVLVDVAQGFAMANQEDSLDLLHRSPPSLDRSRPSASSLKARLLYHTIAVQKMRSRAP